MHYYSKTMSKITSDHFPVVLEISNLGWGPTPIRFTNHLLKDVECNKNFGTWWNNTKQDRHPRYSFVKRLKQLNIQIHKWAKEKNTNAKAKKNLWIKEIDDIDKLEKEIQMIDIDSTRHRVLKADLCNQIHKET